MGAFSTGAQAGQQAAANPFGVMLSTIREATARRTKEDENRKQEEGKLNQALLVLGKKHEFDKALEQEKSDISIREKGTPISKAMRKIGIGTPEKEDLSIPSPNALLENAGLKPRGNVATTSTGEEFFIPEDIKEEKARLDVDKARLESTTEGRKQLATEKAEATAESQTLAQESKEAAKTERNFKIAKNKLKLTFNRFLAATEGGKEGGRVKGFLTTIKGKLGINPAFKDFEGTIVETSTALAKIAAPSAKVGPDLIKLFSTTIPSIGFFSTATPEEAINQTATSATQGFINFAATHPEDFPDEPDFEAFRNSFVEALQEATVGFKGGATEDFSQMSDEELRAIAEGR